MDKFSDTIYRHPFSLVLTHTDGLMGAEIAYKPRLKGVLIKALKTDFTIINGLKEPLREALQSLNTHEIRAFHVINPYKPNTRDCFIIHVTVTGVFVDVNKFRAIRGSCRMIFKKFLNLTAKVVSPEEEKLFNAERKNTARKKKAYKIQV